MGEENVAVDLAVKFAALNDHLSSSGDPSSALHRLTELIVMSVPGCDWAAITAWPAGQKPRTAASSHDVARSVETLQHHLGHGPGLAAAEANVSVHMPNVAEDGRWPGFCAAVHSSSPVRGVLSLHIGDQPDRSVLTLYSGKPDVLDAGAAGLAALLTAHGRVLLAHAAAATKAADLTRALSSSRQIGTAIGVLMSIHKITADGAFERLVCCSQSLNRKLRDIAEDVTRTGALPG